MIYIFNPVTLLLVYIAYSKSSGIARKCLTYVGGVIDIAVNLTWFTVILADIPKELLLTKRVERLKLDAGVRGKIANRICKLLNYFEKDHCR